MSTNDTADSSPINYNYSDNIKSPISIGVHEGGSFPQLGRNINGLKEYIHLLINGNSRASATGKPLGNKYFYNTTAKCNAIDTCTMDDAGKKSCQETDRYIYINNVPVGKSDKGLVPGSLQDVKLINPMKIFKAFSEPATPDCQNIIMQTIDANNNSSSETHYVTLTDIKSMNPCLFNTSEYNYVNPLTNQKCVESFKTGVAENASCAMPDDPIDKVYFAGLACIGIYIFYRIMKKSR